MAQAGHDYGAHTGKTLFTAFDIPTFLESATTAPAVIAQIGITDYAIVQIEYK